MKKIMLILGVLLMVLTGCNSKPVDTGKKAILVVSFGTSYSDTRELTIEATENKFKETYPDYEIVRAFTAQTIIDILRDRDNIEVFNVEEAFKYLKEQGFSDVLVQSLLVINGAENDDMHEIIEQHKEDFVSLKIGNPLLTSSEDYQNVVAALSDDIGELAEDEAVVFMGHGTHHYSNSAYAALEYYFHDNGLKNVFIGTVEGYPEIDQVIARLKENNINKVTLMPLMLVAGDHASNDMAGDEEDSWKTILKQEGFEVETYLHGLGENPKIQEIYIDHAEKALSETETNH